jgi:hypothetical protein
MLLHCCYESEEVHNRDKYTEPELGLLASIFPRHLCIACDGTPTVAVDWKVYLSLPAKLYWTEW